MKIYHVLQDDNEHTVFIKDEFSFLAFTLGLLWIIYQKLWKHAFFITLSIIFLFILKQKNIISQPAILSLQLIVSLFIGAYAKDWQISYLRTQNFKLVSLIAARNDDEAKLKFYQGGCEHEIQ